MKQNKNNKRNKIKEHCKNNNLLKLIEKEIEKQKKEEFKKEFKKLSKEEKQKFNDDNKKKRKIY